jgi:hypothetical protein
MQQLVYDVRSISRIKTHLTQDNRNLGLGSNSILKRNQLSGEVLMVVPTRTFDLKTSKPDL